MSAQQSTEIWVTAACGHAVRHPWPAPSADFDAKLRLKRNCPVCLLGGVSPAGKSQMAAIISEEKGRGSFNFAVRAADRIVGEVLLAPPDKILQALALALQNAGATDGSQRAHADALWRTLVDLLLEDRPG